MVPGEGAETGNSCGGWAPRSFVSDGSHTFQAAGGDSPVSAIHSGHWCGAGQVGKEGSGTTTTSQPCDGPP